MLPNITGNAGGIVGFVIDGAFVRGSIPIAFSSGIGYNINLVSFDASQSNSIYTNSGSVHPLSLSLNYIIKS